MTTYAQRYAQAQANTSTQPAPQRTYQSGGGRKASDGQRKYLMDLRERFGISLQGLATISARDAYAEIEELNKRPLPPTQAQMKVIRENIAELAKAGLIMTISEEKLASLTPGQDGTASKMISFLLDKREEVETIHMAIAELGDEEIDLEVFRDAVLTHGYVGQKIDPLLIEELYKKRHEVEITIPMITDPQVDTISDWYYCPDVPFENFNIDLFVPLEEGGKRRKTKEEFVQDLKDSMTRKEASKLIDDYRGIYYDWRRSRATPKQIQHIRTIEQRLANISTSKAIDFAIGLDGEIIEVESKPTSRDRMPTTAFEPMSDEDLLMMSVENASKLIDQMNFDLNRKFEPEVDNAQQELQDKVNLFSDQYQTGIAKDADDAMSQELHNLQSFIYKLEAMVGSENPELHDMVMEVFITGAHDPEVLVDELRQFMALAIDDSTEDRLKQTYGALLEASDDVPLALQAVQSM